MKKLQDILKEAMPFTIDSAVILAAITAFAYVCTFIYEESYCTNFDIPAELISIDIGSILPFWTKILTGTFFITYVLFFFFFSKPFSKRNPLIYETLTVNLIILILMLLSYILMPRYDFELFVNIGLWVVINLVYFLFLRKLGRNQEFEQHASTNEQTESNNSQEETVEEIEYQIEKSVIKIRIFIYAALLIIAMFTCMFSNMKADADAQNQSSFFVNSSDTTIAVIRIYGDKLVCKRIIYKPHIELANKIIVIKINDSTPLEIELKNLGRLVSFENKIAKNKNN